jgi:hypothetical protein
MGAIPLPLPANFISGLDVQRLEFEQKKWSFLEGEQKLGGWWYYYIVAFTIKTPLGTLVLFAIAVILHLAGAKCRICAIDELCVICPAIAIVVLVSSQTGFSRYLRYILPAFPFIYISISRVAATSVEGHSFRSVISAILLGSAVFESFLVLPHSMSFFNQIAGGPRAGAYHLLDANIDWGQDLLHLRRWMKANPQATPLHLAYFGHETIPPTDVGFEVLNVPMFVASPAAERVAESKQGPQPGWHALSVNYLYGYRHNGEEYQGFTYFQHFSPVAMAGYSIYIYHLDLEDVNPVRMKLGLAPILEE